MEVVQLVQGWLLKIPRCKWIGHDGTRLAGHTRAKKHFLLTTMAVPLLFSPRPSLSPAFQSQVFFHFLIFTLSLFTFSFFTFFFFLFHSIFLSHIISFFLFIFFLLLSLFPFIFFLVYLFILFRTRLFSFLSEFFFFNFRLPFCSLFPISCRTPTLSHMSFIYYSFNSFFLSSFLFLRSIP